MVTRDTHPFLRSISIHPHFPKSDRTRFFTRLFIAFPSFTGTLLTVIGSGFRYSLNQRSCKYRTMQRCACPPRKQRSLTSAVGQMCFVNRPSFVGRCFAADCLCSDSSTYPSKTFRIGSHFASQQSINSPLSSRRIIKASSLSPRRFHPFCTCTGRDSETSFPPPAA